MKQCGRSFLKGRRGCLKSCLAPKFVLVLLLPSKVTIFVTTSTNENKAEHLYLGLNSFIYT